MEVCNFWVEWAATIFGFADLPNNKMPHYIQRLKNIDKYGLLVGALVILCDVNFKSEAQLIWIETR